MYAPINLVPHFLDGGKLEVDNGHVYCVPKQLVISVSRNIPQAVLQASLRVLQAASVVGSGPP